MVSYLWRMKKVILGLMESEDGSSGLSLASSKRISSSLAHWLLKPKSTILPDGAMVKGHETRMSFIMDVSVMG
jgi:hypothetical protein